LLDSLSSYQYNETINDLLGSADFDKKKHEIKHEKIGRHTKTTVTDAAVGAPFLCL
jgi:kinesin family protein C1